MFKSLAHAFFEYHSKKMLVIVALLGDREKRIYQGCDFQIFSQKSPEVEGHIDLNSKSDTYATKKR